MKTFEVYNDDESDHNKNEHDDQESSEQEIQEPIE